MDERRVILILGLAVVVLFWLWRNTKSKLSQAQFSKRSLASGYGKTVEQFMPLMASYPFNPSGFRFLGTPIDGIQFNQNEIVLVEFKSGLSKLNPNQQRIKRLVEQKRVRFLTQKV